MSKKVGMRTLSTLIIFTMLASMAMPPVLSIEGENEETTILVNGASASLNEPLSEAGGEVADETSGGHVGDEAGNTGGEAGGEAGSGVGDVVSGGAIGEAGGEAGGSAIGSAGGEAGGEAGSGVGDVVGGGVIGEAGDEAGGSAIGSAGGEAGGEAGSGVGDVVGGGAIGEAGGSAIGSAGGEAGSGAIGETGGEAVGGADGGTAGEAIGGVSGGVSDGDAHEDSDGLPLHALFEAGIASLSGSLVPFGTPIVTFTAELGEAPYLTAVLDDGITLLDGEYYVEQPANPGIPAGMDLFLGWYYVIDAEITDMAFDFGEPISADAEIDLCAVFGKTFLVNFKNSEGVIIESKQVSSNEAVVCTLEIITPPENAKFAYWYVEEDFTDPHNPPEPFVFGKNADRDMILAPWFDNSYFVFFISEGTLVPYATVDGGTAAKAPSPNPTRAGYSFSHWSGVPGGAEYDFSSPVEENLYLYAVWAPLTVDYTIVYWVEKPNFNGDPGTDHSNYVFYKSVVKQATSGSEVDYTINNGLDKVTLTTVYKDAPVAIEWARFSHGGKAVVQGNGSTVVNVYFKRIVFTYVFNLNPGNNTNTVRNGATMEFDGNLYSQGVNVSASGTGSGSPAIYYPGVKYTFGAKYEQDIEQLWPSSWNAVYNKEARYRNNSSSSWGSVSTQSFTAWDAANANISSANSFATKRFLMTADMLPMSGDTVEINALWGNTIVHQVNYYFEMLPEEADSEWKTFNGGSVYYVLSEKHSQSLANSGTLSAKSITGVVYAGSEYLDKNGVKMIPDGNHTGVLTYNFFYTRNRHSLYFNTMGGDPISHVPGIMFEANLSYGGLYLPNTTPTKTHDGIVYRFEGWYLDAEYMIPFEAGMTMPNSDVTLFAKWESSEFIVKFYNGLSADSYIEGADVGMGSHESLVEAKTPYAYGETVDGLGIFLGWYVYIGDTGYTTRFSYDTPIVSDMDLHAVWKTDGFTLRYSAGAGSGTVPVNNNTYRLGSQSRVASNEGVIPPPGKIFNGWLEENTDKLYYPGMTITLGGNAYFVAQFGDEDSLTQIIYHSNFPDGTQLIVSWNVPKNTNTELADGTLFELQGKAILGWSNSEGQDNSIDYNLEEDIAVGSSPINLYAVWSSAIQHDETYTVWFNSNGGTPVEPITDVPQGNTIDEPTAPTKEGHIFIGWYREEGLLNQWVFESDEVTNSITLFAKWDVDEDDETPLDDNGDDETPIDDNGDDDTPIDDNGDDDTPIDDNGDDDTPIDDNGDDETPIDDNGKTSPAGQRPKGGGNNYPNLIDPRVPGSSALTGTQASTLPSTEFFTDEEAPAGAFISDHVAYVIGYPDGTVRPEKNVTRAEAATVYYRLLTDSVRSENWSQTNEFTDVEPGAWYATAVSVMARMNIIEGYPDGTFRPDGEISRAELAAIAARFAGATGGAIGGASNGYSDITGHWAEYEIEYAAGSGVMIGYPGETFKPNQLITRAEFVTMVNRMLKRVPQSPDDLLYGQMITWPDNANPDAWYYTAIQEATNSHMHNNKEGTKAEGLDFEYEHWTAITDNRDWLALSKKWEIINNEETDEDTDEDITTI